MPAGPCPTRARAWDPSHALYPNERNQVQLARDSSLVGEHQVIGEGVPASMRFTLGSAQDLMPAIDLRTTGKPQDSMGTTWQPVRNARAYYLHGMSQNGRRHGDVVQRRNARHRHGPVRLPAQCHPSTAG
ncbi:MAG: hypothetical protein V9G23_13075 [Giesbergeria sp.]